MSASKKTAKRTAVAKIATKKKATTKSAAKKAAAEHAAKQKAAKQRAAAKQKAANRKAAAKQKSAKQKAAAKPKAAKQKAEDYDDPPMTLWDHLAELRKRLLFCIIAFVIGAVVAWELREYLLALLVDPFRIAWEEHDVPGDVTLHFASPAAHLIAYFKLGVYGGLVMASPIIFYQLWSFVAPGLYAREKKFVIPFVASSTLLFVGGGYFGWRAAFPLLFDYLLELSGALSTSNVNISPTIMMGDYLAFVTRMLLGLGLILEIPLFIFFLSVAGIVNYLHLIRYGRWFVVASFLAAALITPPDPSSQIIMAIPMIILYGGSIGLSYVFGKKPSQEQRDAYKRRKERLKRKRKAT